MPYTRDVPFKHINFDRNPVPGQVDDSRFYARVISALRDILTLQV